MGKNYSGLLNGIYLFGNSYRSFSWSCKSLLSNKEERKTSTAAATANAIATDEVCLSYGTTRTSLVQQTKQSLSSRLTNNLRFSTNFKTTALCSVLLFVVSTVTVYAKNVHSAKTVSTSSTALVKNNTMPSFVDGTFSDTNSMHFYTYIYVPILQIQNKGDCMKEGPLIKPLIRCNTKMNFISQNFPVPNPNKKITNLILNT